MDTRIHVHVCMYFMTLHNLFVIIHFNRALVESSIHTEETTLYMYKKCMYKEDGIDLNKYLNLNYGHAF